MPNARMRREKKVISIMIGIYCHAHHGTAAQALCSSCRSLEHYAHLRIDKCPRCDDKPTCLSCPVHCYQPDRRQHIRTVMRFAGPKMAWRHPLLTLQHKLAERRSPR